MDYPNKSDQQHPTPPPKKVINPVIPGATPVKRPATRRFLDYIFAESPKELAAKTGRDVVVPRLKMALEEAFNSFLGGMLWGNSPRPISNIVKGAVLRPGGGVNYQHISSMPTSPQGLAARAAAEANRERSSGNYQDLVCGTQDQAETLLSEMYQLLNEYRVVAVGDLYELANITPTPSDNAYGWINLDGARISKVREGYLLELPRPSII